jgi:hypothetical protein
LQIKCQHSYHCEKEFPKPNKNYNKKIVHYKLGISNFFLIFFFSGYQPKSDGKRIGQTLGPDQRSPYDPDLESAEGKIQ